jgi:hypothetical protein
MCRVPGVWDPFHTRSRESPLETRRDVAELGIFLTDD